jgi:hypothetical protein
MENKASKILIETHEDKRLEVAIELTKTVNSLAELLKNMDVSISNIHINGISVQTAQGETALQIGNNVKNAMVTNSVFKTDAPTEDYGLNFSYDEDEEDFNSDMFDSKEEQEEWRKNDLMLKPVDEENKERDVDDSKLSRLEKAFEIVNKENEKYRKLVDVMKELFKDENN